MTFIEKSEAKKAELRKQQAELKKCIDDTFNAEVMKLVQAEYDYQAKCRHPNEITVTEKDGGGCRKCPECGWWCAWGVYSTTPPEPPPPPPYPFKDEVEEFIKHITLP